MVDSIGPTKIPSITSIKPVADKDTDEHKRKREQDARRPSGADRGDKKLGNNIDERC